MKIYVDTDEWYPVYSYRTDTIYPDPEIEVTDNEIARLGHAFSEFNWAQDLLSRKLADRG